MYERPRGSSVSGDASRDGWEVYRNVLGLKRLGFSLDEMSRLTMADFIALTDLAFSGEDGGRAREASQGDIDRLLG